MTWLVNVILHAFEHLAKRSKYYGYMTCASVIFHRRDGPFFHILLHWHHTRPPRLWHIRNWTHFFELTEQYRNIPGACNGLVGEMFCKFCQNHGVIHIVAEIRNELKNAFIFCVLHVSSLHFYFSVHTIQCKHHTGMTVTHWYSQSWTMTTSLSFVNVCACSVIAGTDFSRTLYTFLLLVRRSAHL